MTVKPRRSEGIDGRIYARAGEFIYCAEGHPIARFGCDVLIGEHQDVDRQMYWQHPNLTIGATVCPQPGCKAEIAVPDTTGCYYFKDPET